MKIIYFNKKTHSFGEFVEIKNLFIGIGFYVLEPINGECFLMNEDTFMVTQILRE